MSSLSHVRQSDEQAAMGFVSAAFAAAREYPTYAPADSPFETVIVDVTHRCNMGCHNCYIPNRTIPDLDTQWLMARLGQYDARTSHA